MIHHAIFEEDKEEMFYDDPELDRICKHNHSVRNKENAAVNIVKVNELISLALNK